MNKSLHPNDICSIIRDNIPKYLISGKTEQFYGTVEWSVRSVFNQYLGWFSGFEYDLYPSKNKTKGKNIINLIIKIQQNKNKNNIERKLLIFFREKLRDLFYLKYFF